MAETASVDITPYLRHARQRAEVERRQVAGRRERAWALARQAAQVLREQFGARRVVVFGSLTREGRFTRWSDVDLAAWGIEGTAFFKAAAVTGDLTSGFKVDLVDPEDCRPSLRQAIEQEGIEL